MTIALLDRRRERCIALVFVGCVLLGGCTSSSGDALEPLPNSGGPEIEGDYPEGPKGTQVGTVVENFEFDGYVNSRDGLGTEFRETITLGDFYNPTGEDVYGPDDIREEGTPKPTALFINVGAVWCAPCKEEAQTTLPEEYTKLNPKGMELLMVLADSEAVGSPADFSHLDNWCTAFDVFYPAVVDPAQNLGPLFDQSQYPANLIIDTRTMNIVEVVAGIPGDAFFAKMDQVIGNDG